MVDNGKELRDKNGVNDADVSKLGYDEIEEVGVEVKEEQCVNVVKFNLEVSESGVGDEKIKENSAGNGVENSDGMKDGENMVVSDDVYVNVEVYVTGGQSYDPELKGADVEEMGSSDVGEDVQKLSLNGGKEVGHEEASEVNATGEFHQLDKPVVQEGTDTQDPEVQIDDTSTAVAEHNATGELDKPVAQKGTDTQDAEVQIDDDAPTAVVEHNAIKEFQQLEVDKHVFHEVIGTVTQDAEIQIDDAATGMTEHNFSTNVEEVPEYTETDVKDKLVHTEHLELTAAVECQAEAVLTEGTVNSVLGESESNAIVENNGDKLDVLSEVDFDTDGQPENGMSQMEWSLSNEQVDESKANHFVTPEMEIQHVKVEDPKADEEKLNSSLFLEGDESGTEEERIAFFREVETFFKARATDFRAPKFYGEPLNLLKLWRAVIRLGGYEQVTSCKLWRQIGESFNPPKTCTTVSWTFRLFYEKTLLEFEKHKMRGGDLPYDNSFTEFDTQTQDGMQSGGSQGLGSGRVMRDSAARAMQGWHSHRSLSNGEIGDPIIKDKSLSLTLMREKYTKTHDFASLKRKTTYPIEQPSKLARSKPQMEISVIDAEEPANWVKINIRKTKDCFEIYALVPGLTREEVRVQSDPAGRIVISGEPQQLDNPWGVTPFKKVVSLPSRIDPHQTSAVVTLHGQLFVRVPYSQIDG